MEFGLGHERLHCGKTSDHILVHTSMVVVSFRYGTALPLVALLFRIHNRKTS
jgi:hypothetical protein